MRCSQSWRLLLFFHSVNAVSCKKWRDRALLIVGVALLLFTKIAWENSLPAGRTQEALRIAVAQGDSGACVASLFGLRAIAADAAWLQVTTAWQERNWPALARHAERTLALRPEEPLFFELAGWHLAWNAALDVRDDVQREASAEIRKMQVRAWIERGRAILREGVARHSSHFSLLELLALLEGQQRGDWSAAAAGYERAAALRGAPAYAVRLAADAHERAGEWPAARDAWQRAWEDPRRELLSRKAQQRLQEKIRHAAGKAAVTRD